MLPLATSCRTYHSIQLCIIDVINQSHLSNALARKEFSLKSIVYCLHKPLEDAYIETNNNVTNPTSFGATTLSPGQTGALTVGSGGSSSTSMSKGGSGSHGGAGFVNTQVNLGGLLGSFVMVLGGVFGGAILL